MKARKLFTVCASLLIGIGFAGCGDPTGGVNPVAVTGVTLDISSETLPKGASLTLTATVAPSNATNKAVSWDSSDKNVATVDDDGLVTAVAVGTATITVTTVDGGYEDPCTVTVTPKVTSIQVDTSQDKTKILYKLGEEFDLDGLVVSATYEVEYDDGKNGIIDIESLEISGFDPNVTGEQTITVSYIYGEDISDTFTVWVLALTKIEIIKPSPDYIPIVPSGFDLALEHLDKIGVEATWGDDSTDKTIIETIPITLEYIDTSNFNKSRAEEQTLTFIYEGITVPLKIVVKGLTGITIDQGPTKTLYKLGEELDLDGLEVTATYSDNDEEKVTIILEHIIGFDSSDFETDQIVTVSYGGHEDTFTVSIGPTITFNPNGGAWGSSTANQTVLVKVNTTVAAPPDDPTLTGCTFDGWFKNATGGNKLVFPLTVNANETLHAQWSCNVTFNPNGGNWDGSTANKDVTVKEGTPVSNAKPANPDRTDYTFEGWYTQAEGGTEFDFDENITADRTLYAQWECVQNYNQWIVTTEPTSFITEDGVETETCSNGCHTRGTRPVSLLIRTTENWTTALSQLNGKTGEGYSLTIEGDIGVAGISYSSYNFGTTATGASLSVTLKGSGKLYLTSQGNLIRIGARQTLIIDSETLILEGRKIGQNNSTQNNNEHVVHVESNGTLELRNGTISGNTNTSYSFGSGVDVNGTFTMYGGEISGNNQTATNGGGVMISTNGTFTMHGGIISGNTAASQGGGGVVAYNNGTFIMYGGKISGNTAGSGGGVMISTNGTFTMHGGEIFDNTATDRGGGVYGGGTFRIVNGTIYGSNEDDESLRNTAPSGAALSRSSGTYQHGTFGGANGTTWTSRGTLTTTDNTIKVEDGEIVP